MQVWWFVAPLAASWRAPWALTWADGRMALQRAAQTARGLPKPAVTVGYGGFIGAAEGVSGSEFFFM
jgi:hypothetical protein